METIVPFGGTDRKTTTSNATICEWTITGMDCGSCAGKVRGAVERRPEVSQVDAALMAVRLRLTLDEDQTSRDHVETAVKKLGFGIAPKGAAAPRKGFVMPDDAFPAGSNGDAPLGTETPQGAPAQTDGPAARDASWHQTGKGRPVIGAGALLVAAWAVELAALDGIANWAFILATLIGVRADRPSRCKHGPRGHAVHHRDADDHRGHRRAGHRRC
jgi:Cd2+/Zn2+-exporting ATPase